MIGSIIISGSGMDSIGAPFYVFDALSGKGWAGSGVGVMNDIKNKNLFLKILLVCIATTALLLSACSITPVVTTFKNSSGVAIKTENTWEVKKPICDGSGNCSGNEVHTFNDLQSAQNFVAEINSSYANSGMFSFGVPKGPVYFFQSLMLLPLNTTNREVVVEDSKQKSTTQTSVQQGIISSGHSTTQQPQQDNNILSNFTLNGMDPSTKTGLAGAAAIAVMGGITAGVVTAVNKQAQQAQQEQNSKNLWAIVTATAKGAASGGPSCQCNSATQTSPPYCTGAGICNCGTQNCPP